MKRLLVSVLGVAALGVAALGVFGPTGTVIAQVPQPETPAQCEDMAPFDKTIVVTSPGPVIIKDSGVLLVFGRPNLPNNIAVPWATRVCLVGGTMNDELSTGRGDDVIIGNGSTRTRDHLNAFGGSDVCYDDLGTVFVSCESIITLQ